MKTAQINKFGGPDTVKMQEVKQPEVKPGKLLIEVKAAGLNPFDSKVRQGNIPLELPLTLGGDYAGIVIQAADDVLGFKTGDEVYGTANVVGGGTGSLAEITMGRATQAALKPATLKFSEAASLPLAGVSALQALTEHIKLNAHDKILIHGGAGGIGSIAIQLAKYIGAEVATTVSTDDMDFVKRLGADLVIDYKHENFEEFVKDYDAVFDTVASEANYVRSLAVLKPGGVIVTMLPMPDSAVSQRKDVTQIAQSTQVTTEKLSRLSSLVDAGKICPVIDKVFSFDETGEAFAYLEEHSVRGKVVVSIPGPAADSQ